MNAVEILSAVWTGCTYDIETMLGTLLIAFSAGRVVSYAMRSRFGY